MYLVDRKPIGNDGEKEETCCCLGLTPPLPYPLSINLADWFVFCLFLQYQITEGHSYFVP